MKIHILTGLIVVAILISGCTQISKPEYCGDISWHFIFEEDSNWNVTYNNLTEPEQSFRGMIAYAFDENCKSPILQRCTPYKLNGVSVYTGSKNLEKYKGYEVEIIGKKLSFELEGYHREEIWPLKIRCIPKPESEEEIDEDTVLVKIETWGCTDFDKGKILRVRHGSFEIIEDECSAKFEKAFGATADCKTKLVSGDCVEGDTMHWTGCIVTIIRCPERFREEITEDSVLIETTVRGCKDISCFYKGDVLNFSHGSLKIIDECRQKHTRINRGPRTITTYNCYAKLVSGDCVKEDNFSWSSPLEVIGAASCFATIKKCPEKYKKEFNLEIEKNEKAPFGECPKFRDLS